MFLVQTPEIVVAPFAIPTLDIDKLQGLSDDFAHFDRFLYRVLMLNLISSSGKVVKL